MSFSSRELLARLIRCEAEGEGEMGMKAVASVVMNRVNVTYGEYRRVGQGDLRKIIMQPRQFTCCMTKVYGQINYQNIWAKPPTDYHYWIADWALSGQKLPGVGFALWYYNPFKPNCAYFFPITKTGRYVTRIAQHCFYNPTELYAQT
ncbi:Cell wall hydrolase CwlJ [Caloramator mitchellensis]|uniref:Cell wall hydrolase CwlJ n=1 Tax=Caloramator mitchellensis TaxID=908809 RepID=A0A0R3JYK5_CALMK|nr:cell wall hydrolase [Caloramator mitchellensis]KRQ87389.1 Cell wall hydrolase CwlJ [Caloramator mitchellensis]